jgi:Phage tail tube protein
MGTGLDASLGFAVEDKYGEYKAPSDFIEVESIGLQRKPNYTQSRPLRRRPGIPVSRHKETTHFAEGPIALEIPNKGLGPILFMLHGEDEETAGPKKQGETIAYRQEHPIGVTAPNGKSLTIQANKPTIEQDEPFTYLGSKFTQVTFSCDTSAQLKMSLDTNAQTLVTNKSLTVASYPDPISSRLFDEAVVTIDGEAVTASDLIINSFNLVIPLPMKTGRHGLGRGGTQAEPIGFNDTMKPTLEFACEFTNLDLYNHHINEDEVPVSIAFVGPVIAGGFKEEIAFDIPVTKFIGEDPAVSGPDVVSQSASIEVYDSIEDPLVTIAYQSIDSAL